MHFNVSNFLAPYLHQFSVVVQIVPFFVLFELNLVSSLKKKYTETAPSNGAILDEFSEQH